MENTKDPLAAPTAGSPHGLPPTCLPHPVSHHPVPLPGSFKLLEYAMLLLPQSFAFTAHLLKIMMKMMMADTYYVIVTLLSVSFSSMTLLFLLYFLSSSFGGWYRCRGVVLS